MKVTAYVTRDIGRTFGVTHGPITRSDPIRSDPALLQPHRWSPSHHGVTQVTRGARDSAPVVAPSPVVSPDAMMSLTAIEHLDFRADVRGQDRERRARRLRSLERLNGCSTELPDVSPTWCICRTHFDEAIRVGLEYTPFLPPPLRIVQVLR